MKRTELEKRERELRRAQKKEDVIARKMGGGSVSVGDFINELFSLFRYDGNEIFNTKDDINVLEALESMKSTLPEKQWENVIRKAVKKTNIAEKDRAVDELRELVGA